MYFYLCNKALFHPHLAELQEINKLQQDEAVLCDNFNVYYRFLRDEPLTELCEQYAPHPPSCLSTPRLFGTHQA